MRKSKIDWELYREQLCELRYNEKKSLTEINAIIFSKFQVSYSNARISQIFSKWAKEEPSVAEQDAEVFIKTQG